MAERHKISELHSSGESARSIARILGRSPSTISRELNRVQTDKFRGNYIASTTHEKVQELWKNSHKKQKSILKQRNVRDFVEKYLQYGYSPAIISHLLQERFCEKVSHETLYIYIYSSPKGLRKYLLRRKQGRKSKKNNRFSYIGTGKNIPNRIDIENQVCSNNFKFESKVKSLTLSHIFVSHITAGRKEQWKISMD